MYSCAKTDVGMKRQMNQDYIFASDTAVGKLPNLYIIADGMGGHNAGDFASRYCVEEFTRIIRESRERTVISTIEKALMETNEELIKEAAEHPEMDGMGTTFVMATINEGTMNVANIGDSRLYIIGKEMEQVTFDHSLVAEMVRNGDIKKDEARFHPKKNIVTRAISAMGVVTPDHFEIKLKEDDMVLLCSDGLSNMLSDSEIYDTVKLYGGDVEKTVDVLIDMANKNGGRDNISIILVKGGDR